jgi:hypothetical protein
VVHKGAWSEPDGSGEKAPARNKNLITLESKLDEALNWEINKK